MDSTSEDLFHIALLIDQLRHDDTNVRNTAATNLTRIGNYNLLYFDAVLFDVTMLS